MRKKARLWVLIIIVFVMMAPICRAQEQDASVVLESQLGLLDWDTIEEVENKLKATAPHMEDFDLEEEVRNLVMGKTQFSLEYILEKVGNIFFQEAGTYFKLIVRFVLIVIMCSLLQTLSTSFKSQQTTKAAFLVCYFFVIFLVSQSLFMVVELAHETITHLGNMMLAALPTLLAFMAISGYVTSSSALATVIISGMNIMTFVVNNVVLPVVVGLIILQIVGSMSEEIKVDKFVKLFYKGVRWSLRFVFVSSIGIMGMYKLTLPYVDVAIKKSALSFSTSFIPVVGDASKGAIEFILACGQLIKNSFALGVVIWVVVIASVPLIKLFLYVCMYHLAGAVIQPVGDKKMSEIASVLAKGCEFVLSCTGTIVMLAIVVMIICASIGTSIT